MAARVLFVCMGNICRSPTAEGVFKHLVAKHGLAVEIESDSAGTHDYHIGEPPDQRSQAAALRRGYDLSVLRARQVTADDFAAFDYVLAMDKVNLAALHRLCPAQYRDRVKLFLEFAPQAGRLDVPDPYYGGEKGFEEVLDLVELAAQGLLDHIAGPH
jgi:protein-tyrosine phosphatase